MNCPQTTNAYKVFPIFRGFVGFLCFPVLRYVLPVDVLIRHGNIAVYIAMSVPIPLTDGLG